MREAVKHSGGLGLIDVVDQTQIDSSEAKQGNQLNQIPEPPVAIEKVARSKESLPCL